MNKVSLVLLGLMATTCVPDTLYGAQRHLRKPAPAVPAEVPVSDAERAAQERLLAEANARREAEFEERVTAEAQRLSEEKKRIERQQSPQEKPGGYRDDRLGALLRRTAELVNRASGLSPQTPEKEPSAAAAAAPRRSPAAERQENFELYPIKQRPSRLRADDLEASPVVVAGVVEEELLPRRSPERSPAAAAAAAAPMRLGPPTAPPLPRADASAPAPMRLGPPAAPPLPAAAAADLARASSSEDSDRQDSVSRGSSDSGDRLDVLERDLKRITIALQKMGGVDASLVGKRKPLAANATAKEIEDAKAREKHMAALEARLAQIRAKLDKEG